MSAAAVLVEGWAIMDGHPAKSVALWVADTVVGFAKVGISRPDIATGFADDTLERSGFRVVLDLSDFIGASVEITATVTVRDEQRQLVRRPIGTTSVHLSGEVESLDGAVPSEEDLRSLSSQWWYYSVELSPEIVARSDIHDVAFPLLPRIMLRHCDLEMMDCLDIGSMEGLLPTLMCRQGARTVLATDFDDWCAQKLAAVRSAYGVDFSYRSVGLLYDLYEKLAGANFDLINLSGVLYHTWSPLKILSGVRPLLRRNGLMIVSTNVLLSSECTMLFNQGGSLQGECNVFWYMSLGMLDYALRYLRLRPVHVLHVSHSHMPGTPALPRPDGRYAYVSVLCRAVERSDQDEWMRTSSTGSIEYLHNADWAMAEAQPLSGIKTKGLANGERAVSLWDQVVDQAGLSGHVDRQDTYFLRLDDRV